VPAAPAANCYEWEAGTSGGDGVAALPWRWLRVWANQSPMRRPPAGVGEHPVDAAVDLHELLPGDGEPVVQVGDVAGGWVGRLATTDMVGMVSRGGRSDRSAR